MHYELCAKRGETALHKALVSITQRILHSFTIPAQMNYFVYIKPHSTHPKAPIPRLRISISIHIANADKKWNTLNNVGAILVVCISIRINFVCKQHA